MRKLLIIFDPVPENFSVQFDLISSIVKDLITNYDITVYSPYIPENRQRELEERRIKVIRDRKKGFFLFRLLKMLKLGNESVLWFESWIRQVYFGKNEKTVQRNIADSPFDFVINLSYTIPFQSNVLWIQGPPVAVTLERMSGTSSLISLIFSVFGNHINNADLKHLRKMKSKSKEMVVSSEFLHKIFRNLGFSISGVVYSVKDMTRLKPTTKTPSRDYVLLYLGKETDIEAAIKMAKTGIRIIAFGSKVPAGFVHRISFPNITFKGFVKEDELIDLYSNALFTAFPFTTEGLGWVPIESMACGTPVLTYNRDGPSETVLDGVTGSLVETCDQFAKTAEEWWRNKCTGFDAERCIKRAEDFSISKTLEELKNIMGKTGGYNEIYSNN